MPIVIATELTKDDILNSPVVECGKFVVSDQERLISPAGYSPDSNVRVQTEIMLHFDIKPTSDEIALLPNCYDSQGRRLQLFLHEICS